MRITYTPSSEQRGVSPQARVGGTFRQHAVIMCKQCSGRTLSSMRSRLVCQPGQISLGAETEKTRSVLSAEEAACRRISRRTATSGTHDRMPNAEVQDAGQPIASAQGAVTYIALFGCQIGPRSGGMEGLGLSHASIVCRGGEMLRGKQGNGILLSRWSGRWGLL
jgi:hypothetical protein